jgi:hypothetical protein
VLLRQKVLSKLGGGDLGKVLVLGNGQHLRFGQVADDPGSLRA